MRFRPRLARALVLACGLLATFGLFQEAQEPPGSASPGVPTFRGGVSAVLVDVVVIDREGQADLRPRPERTFRSSRTESRRTIATFDVTDWTSYVGERTAGALTGRRRQHLSPPVHLHRQPPGREVRVPEPREARPLGVHRGVHGRRRRGHGHRHRATR